MRRQGGACALVVALVLAACSSQTTPLPTATPTQAQTPAPSPSPSPSPPPRAAESLGEALALVGPVPQRIHFTDWAAIRASVGAGDLTGASAFEDKARALRNEAMLGGFGLPYLQTHALDWGFDVFDLDWEAVTQTGGPAVWTLHFRKGFDLSAVAAKLDAYGFATEDLSRGTLRTGTIANFRQGERLLTNILFLSTGILDDGRTLVLSAIADPDLGNPVREVLSDGPQPVVDLSVQSVAGLLGAPLVATFLVGDWCHQVARFIGNQVPAGVRAAIDAQFNEAGPLGAYNVLAVAYSRSNGLSSGRIVLGYPEEGQAEADLEGRRRLAAEGISIASRDATALVRYADHSFVLVGARVEARSIVLDVGPPTIVPPSPNPSAIGLITDFLPRGLTTLVQREDLLFATCTE